MKKELKNVSFVSSMALLGVKALGLESLEWDPLSLRDAFEAYYDIEKLPQRMFDRLNCGYTLINTNAYTNTIEGFLSCNDVLAGGVFDCSEVPYNSLSEVAWGVWEYCNLMGEIRDGQPTEEFCPDIIVYIQALADQHGLTTLPKWLSFATPTKGLPDESWDVHAFEMYNNRQQSTVAALNKYVTERQAILTNELKQLKSAKIL